MAGVRHLEVRPNAGSRGTTLEGPFAVAIPYKNFVMIGLEAFTL